MIIQCPSCETKFSVASDLVANAENPRFHCSRCSHYFRVEEAVESQSVEVSPDSTSHDSTSHDSNTKEPEGDKLPAEAKQMSLLQQSLEVEATPNASSTDENGISPELASMALAEDSENEDDNLDFAGFTVGASQDTSAEISPEEDEPEDFDSIDEESEESFDEPQDSSQEQLVASWPEPVASDQFPFSRTVVPDLEEEEALEEKIPEEAVFNTSTESMHHNHSYLENQIKTENSEIEELSRGEKPKSEKTSSLGIILMVIFPLLVCASIFYWSKNLDKSPAFISDLLKLKPVSLEQVASPLVATKAITARTLSLQDGTPVLEVSGLVRNSSNRNYRDIKLEVTLFDQNSVLLAKEIVSLTNSLHEASSITTIGKEKLVELQSSVGSRDINFTAEENSAGDSDASMRSTKELPFRVLILDPPSHVIWYSARVYSAVPK